MEDCFKKGLLEKGRAEGAGRWRHRGSVRDVRLGAQTKRLAAWLAGLPSGAR